MKKRLQIKLIFFLVIIIVLIISNIIILDKKVSSNIIAKNTESIDKTTAISIEEQNISAEEKNRIIKQLVSMGYLT